MCYRNVYVSKFDGRTVLGVPLKTKDACRQMRPTKFDTLQAIGVVTSKPS